MSQRPSLAITMVIDAAEIEAILWAACEEDCRAAGEDAVTTISFAVARDIGSDLALADAPARDAAIELVACASLVKELARGYSMFTLRERRLPTATELVLEAGKLGATLVRDAFALARTYLTQRSIC